MKGYCGEGEGTSGGDWKDCTHKKQVNGAYERNALGMILTKPMGLAGGIDS